MGHVPIPPAPTSAEMALALYERRWTREMRGRSSLLPWRRRRAHRACQTLIRARDAVLGFAPDPWALRAPPKPSDYGVHTPNTGKRSL